MRWLTAEDPARRGDAETLLPGARSVLMVGARYADGPRREDPLPGEAVGAEDDERPAIGRISNYARGADYHRVLGAKLRALIDDARPLLGEEAAMRAFVDTAPILERAFAAAAGIGWLAKNACLIHPGTGSYVFLGGIVTDVELAASAPLASPDLCGSCTACLDACPTDAFVAPRVLDARRCITYWTVEHRGAVPEEWRGALGEHVFGCDICQQVCPWNKWAAPTTIAELAPRPENDAPPLVELIARVEASFKKAFGDTAVTRTRKRGMLRNAAIAAGNSGDPALRPAMDRLAGSEDEVVAEAARWARDRLTGDPSRGGCGPGSPTASRMSPRRHGGHGESTERAPGPG